ncbi:MAG: chromosome segregation protein SMC [Chloroflexota bacterium]
MSRLKELRLHGFKSFADPTRFVFEPGVNAVIGPNGSGKSNMADAVRWVLGEQSNRYLRTRRAEDVIFAGSQARKPQGMAEAVLTLDNGDGSLPIEFGEVSIGRRAYRSGESEYLINGARARLRDIVDLLGEGQLGANALVVVGQGTVDAALSLRPEERRQLFEDAAGVKSLQVRKNEALSRLARSRDNLVRVADLVGELKPQVRRLALQAQHQQEHASLGSRARAMVVELHRRRETQLRSVLGEARRAAASAEAALEAHRAGQAAGREQVERAEAAYWEAEAAARGAGEGRSATREALVRAEGRLESLMARVGEIEAAIRRDEASLADAQAALVDLTDASALEAEIGPAIEASRTAEEGWRAAIATLAAADAALLEAEERLSAARALDADRLAASARATERQAAVAERVRRLESEHAAAVGTVDDASAALRPATALAAERVAEAERARTALQEAERDVEDAVRAADETRQRASEIDRRTRTLEAELTALEERASHGGRLAPRLVAAGWTALLDALDPPQAAWAAIEAIVGGALDEAVLWDGTDPGPSAGASGGVARLLADGRPDEDERAAALAAVGSERTLADLLGSVTLPLALRRVAMAPDLAHLLSGWQRLPAGWVAVTEAGDFADGRGVVTVRGRDDAHAGEAARLHARRRDLAAELGTLRTARDEAQANATEAEARREERRAARIERRDVADQAERAQRAAAAAHGAAAARADRAQADVERFAAALHEARAQAQLHDAEQMQAAPADAGLESLVTAAGQARRSRDAAAAERDAARERWQAARAIAEAAEARSAGSRGARSMAEARIANLESALPAQSATLTTMFGDRDAAEAALHDARAADDATAAALAAADAAREARRRELLELERGSGGAAARLAELERAAQATAIDASRAEDALAAAGRERELALEAIAEAPETAEPPGGSEEPEQPLDLAAFEDTDLEAELRRVRRTLGQIGSVNPFAIEEHRELAERLEGLSSQEHDLDGAISSTEELIGTLDTEINERFNTAFAQIATRFDEFCQLLFAGGSASLQLSDGEDGEAPGGIEIVVRPPGKRLQRLAMLSGGERALAGVALLFAMLSVNPVPFCILDEVDAALDEANIGRFADALRKLSESIDFVVITHNRATIEVADTIYGVTMTDAAVSRVLSLRLADLPAEVSA